MKNFLFLISMYLLFAACMFAQDEKLPILNGAAIELPKPDYPIDAENHCVKGEARVEIEYKATGGNPLSAKMISGHELLKESVESAAMKAQLQVVMHADPKAVFKGILIYNFFATKNILCIDTKRVLNDRVKKFPGSKIDSRSQRPINETDITLAIVVDELGNVVYAKADASTPVMHRSNAEKIARKVTFSPTPHGTPIKARGLLVLRFQPEGSVTLPKFPPQK